jgi:hypothetical protein
VHHSVFTNTKFKRLPVAERYCYLHLYYLASLSLERGIINDLDDEEIAFELDLETEDWLTLKAKLKVKGFIDFSRKAIIISKWNEEQYDSDSSTERVKKHRREKMKRFSNVTETEMKRFSNVTETEMKRFSNVTETEMKQQSIVTVTPPDTDPDPDPDPDPEKIKTPPTPPRGQGGLKNFQEAEQPTAPIATATIASETKPISEQPQTSNGQGKSSAALARVLKHYGGQLPPWRTDGGYDRGFLKAAEAWREKLPSGSYFANHTPEQIIAHWEARGEFENLESRWAQYKNAPSNGCDPTHYPIPIPEPDDLGETIAVIEAHLKLLNLSKREIAAHMFANSHWPETLRVLIFNGSNIATFSRLDEDQLFELQAEIQYLMELHNKNV